LQLGVLLRLLNLDGSFLKNHCHPLIRSMERETGIEPATNSLEGCDSTTELLPPCRAPGFADSSPRPIGRSVGTSRAQSFKPITRLLDDPITKSSLLVAREGLEPSKPLGRQIYSLLRLTASLPRQLPVFFWNALFSRKPTDG